MPSEVHLTLNDTIGIRVATARRRGLKAAGDAILAISDLNAPREPIPRHGVHLTETGFTRIEPNEGQDAVAIGYSAFWAIWQEEDLTYNHPDGGHAKFLSGALLEGQAAVDEFVPAAIRAALAE
jgi:hypothetical protein